MKTIYWSGIWNDDRLAGIRRIEGCINQYGAITDFKFFSDLSVSLVIEIGETGIQPLFENLIKIMDISKHDETIPETASEYVILFNVTFTRGSGNLRVEVPAVPG